MLRLASAVTVALLAIAGAKAAAASTVIPVQGQIRALAIGDDAIVLARLPPRGGLVLERLATGSAAQTVFTTPSDDEDDLISLAASDEAIAFGLNQEPDDGFTAGKVMIGPARGPLREAARCAAGLLVSPVAVAGSRVAWREGGCGEPAADPKSVSPAAIAIGDADPAAAVRRVAIAPERLPVSLLLGAGDTGLVTILQPSFFGFDSEVRAFSPAGLGATLAADRAGLVTPVGLLADGTGVFLESGLEGECDSTRLVTIAPGASTRRAVPIGGCLLAAPTFAPRDGTSPVVAGGRIVVLVRTQTSGGLASDATSIVSVRPDGSDRRVLVKGGYRRPDGVAAAGDRVAWWQPRCAGGQEIVVQQAPEASVKLAACRAEILTRRARVRNGRIGVRLRCPAGCSGTLIGRRLPPPQFAFGAGTHRLSVRVALGRRRSATVRIHLEIVNGPSRSAAVNVRR